MGKGFTGCCERQGFTTTLLIVCAIAMLTLPVPRALANPLGSRAKEGKETLSALVLTQRHSYLGDNRITISDNAVRMQNLGRMGFILVASKPDWKITIYRSDDRTYYTESLADFAETGLFSDMVVLRQTRILDGNPRITASKLGPLASKRATREGRIIEYLPLGKIAPEIEKILFAAYKTPTNGGIPLYFSKQTSGKDWLTGIPDKDKHREVLATQTVKTEFVTPAFYSVPAGFRPVKAAQQVICSKANRAGAGDFGEIFAIGQRKNK